jgi:hypothetical protein
VQNLRWQNREQPSTRGTGEGPPRACMSTRRTASVAAIPGTPVFRQKWTKGCAAWKSRRRLSPPAADVASPSRPCRSWGWWIFPESLTAGRVSCMRPIAGRRESPERETGIPGGRQAWQHSRKSTHSRKVKTQSQVNTQSQINTQLIRQQA